MASVGRIRTTLHSAINHQMDKKLKQSGIDSIKKALEYSGRDVISITEFSNNPDVIVADNPNTSVDESGYDYSTTPPTADASYETVSERFDNLDDYILILQATIVSLQSQIDVLEASNATWYNVQYVASGNITQIILPLTPIVVRVWKNGLRMYNGAGYDYTLSGSTILITGISGDRFVIDYSSSGAGS